MAVRRIGYCTNVHAGANWEQTRANLAEHAPAVRAAYCPGEPMGIGLWLSASSAHKLVSEQGIPEFRDWLQSQGLVPYTFNGFPHGDFHQPVVKHRVYEPTWWEPARLAYTKQLVDILHELLPSGDDGSISTLPIAWGEPMPPRENLAAAGEQLKQLAQYLENLEQRTGRLITIAIEPEPGCVFDTSAGAIDFFQKYLLNGADAERVRRYIRICHDVCHAAVMFEDQAAVLRNLAAAGIGIGKVQISSAVAIDFGPLSPDERTAAFAQLSAFNEPRYLHQTVIRASADAPTQYYQDLPPALATVTDPRTLTSQWRVHFHVPIYLAEFGLLKSSQPDILATLSAIDPSVEHYEVETYAWSVVPQELKQPTLAAGIAEELKWLAKLKG